MKKNIINLIKKLRIETNISILECKKALIDAKGNIEKAKKILKYKFNIKNNNIISKITLKGMILSYINNKYGSLLEINCETDFILKNKKFIKFVNKIAKLIVKNKIYNNINKINYNKFKTIEQKNIELINYFKENIIIKKYKFFKTKNNLISYIHDNKIGVMLEYKGKNKKISEYIAMHIAAMQPLYLSKNIIPNKIIEKEIKNIKNKLKNKFFLNNKLKNKVIKNYLNKYFQENCLLDQIFIKNNKQNIFNILKINNIDIKSYCIFILGKK